MNTKLILIESKRKETGHILDLTKDSMFQMMLSTQDNKTTIKLRPLQNMKELLMHANQESKFLQKTMISLGENYTRITTGRITRKSWLRLAMQWMQKTVTWMLKSKHSKRFWNNQQETWRHKHWDSQPDSNFQKERGWLSPMRESETCLTCADHKSHKKESFHSMMKKFWI